MLSEADITRVHMTTGTYFAKVMVVISGQCYTFLKSQNLLIFLKYFSNHTYIIINTDASWVLSMCRPLFLEPR